ncbi:MAG: hypothetical protein QNK38_05810 [Nitrospirota bacterium]|nr:hypothetical protein [Nitrospirota bacterium]MDX2420606.1 hypothetical protein [Nitrospirota bacterium]
MAKPVGKLKKINLNEVWANEVDGFASWLQQEEILEMLGEALELSLKSAGGEIPLDTLPGAVLAKDAKRGHYVIVLGHLDGMSHEAFGKLIMYAAGLEAKAMICVGQEITAEIRQSLDWLNMVSRDDVNFYATELELWRIDDSVPAPNFKVVCQPNMWARQLKMGQEDGESSENSKSKNFSESKSKKEDPSKGSKEKVGAPQGKSAPDPKDGVSVRQNFVYTKTFS